MHRTRRAYADGASPTRRANSSLKLPKLENPTSKQTSVTEYSPPASNHRARSSLAPVRNWWGVTPNNPSNTRMK